MCQGNIHWISVTEFAFIHKLFSKVYDIMEIWSKVVIVIHLGIKWHGYYRIVIIIIIIGRRSVWYYYNDACSSSSSTTERSFSLCSLFRLCRAKNPLKYSPCQATTMAVVIYSRVLHNNVILGTYLSEPTISLDLRWQEII